ncbi:MAG: response regulator transcription factor [Roseivirga sp.]
MSEIIQIIVADDHRLVREGIVRILNDHSEFTVIAEAENGKQALEKCEMFSPDVLLLDLDMPVLNGLDAVPLLKKQFPALKIGILTMHEEKLLIEKMIKLGVHGYLYKSSEPAELLEGVSKIAAGKTFYTSAVTENLVKSDTLFKNTSHDQTLLLAQLSDREKEILTLIAQGMSNTEIGEELSISHRTVDSHRQNLLKKLEVKNLAGLIRFALTSGLTS